MNTCKDCKFYDEMTKFCRALPPQPVVVPPNKRKDYNTREGNTTDRPLILTKYPIILMPEKDWCGLFQHYNDELIEG